MPSAGVVGARRRGLPTTRTVVGGFLIALAAVIVASVALARAGDHAKQYVVAAHTLASGTVIGPGDVTTAGAQLPPGAQASAFRQTNTLIGRSLSVTVGPGELIQSSMLSLAGGSSGLRPVSVTVDANSLSGLAPGDSVDVLATASNPDGSTQVSVVMRGASLISVSQPSSNLLSGSTSGPLVTLGVGNLAEVEAVVAAAHGGTLELVEAEPSDGVGAGPGPTGTPISSPPTS